MGHNLYGVTIMATRVKISEYKLTNDIDGRVGYGESLIDDKHWQKFGTAAEIKTKLKVTSDERGRAGKKRHTVKA